MSRKYAVVINVPEGGKWSSIFAFVVGLSYASTGVLQLIVSLGLAGPIVGFTDFVGGFLLMVVAAVFLIGVKPLSKNEQEGYAFIAVGYILGAVLFVLQIMVILTNSLGWLLRFENWLGWNLFNDITPSLWLFIILMTTTGFLWILGKLREKLIPDTKEDAQQ
ncbi:MAG: hypothetical protein ACFFCT_01275 [Candidatus Odinarchaeota archaeon]